MKMFSDYEDEDDLYSGIKLFDDCSGPCETCKTHFIGGCIAGHGDDYYSYASPEWIKEFNLKKLRNKENKLK